MMIIIAYLGIAVVVATLEAIYRTVVDVHATPLQIALFGLMWLPVTIMFVVMLVVGLAIVRGIERPMMAATATDSVVEDVDE